MKIKSTHVIAAIFIVGLIIYVFTKKKVTGVVIADESEAIITLSGRGTVSYGMELGDS